MLHWRLLACNPLYSVPRSAAGITACWCRRFGLETRHSTPICIRKLHHCLPQEWRGHRGTLLLGLWALVRSVARLAAAARRTSWAGGLHGTHADPGCEFWLVLVVHLTGLDAL